MIEIRQTPENRIIFGGSYEPSNLVFYLENHAAGDKSLNKMFGSQNFGPIRREWACSIGRKFVLKTETFKIHTLNFVTQFNILPQTQAGRGALEKRSAVGFCLGSGLVWQL